MGIRGTVKRNQDGDFIHANVDLDVIVTEEPEYGDLTKPAEMFRIIEHFCLGRRRLYLFGGDAQIRPGKHKIRTGVDLCVGSRSVGTTIAVQMELLCTCDLPFKQCITCLSVALRHRCTLSKFMSCEFSTACVYVQSMRVCVCTF